MDVSVKTDQGDAGLDQQPSMNEKSSAWRQVVANLRDEDKTPLVLLLLQVIEEQAQRIAALEAEIVHLKGGPKKPASNRKPSALSKPTIVARVDGKRPGSEKRSKTKDLPIHEQIPIPPKDLPTGSTCVRRDPYVVQDLLVEARNTRYW